MLALAILTHCARRDDGSIARRRVGPLERDRTQLVRARVGSVTRFALPEATRDFPTTIPPGATLQVAFGVTSGGWKRLSQVQFTVSFDSGGESEILMDETLTRSAEEGAPRWRDRRLPLGTLAGRRGTLRLQAGAVHGRAAGDGEVAWADPVIVDGRRQSERPNIILVSIDTLRADHLGCYGYDRDTSPNIDRMAAEGVRFRTAISAASWTLPSHASMLTGLNPDRHGAVKLDFTTPIRPETDTIAELLWDRGYRTAAFTGGLFVSQALGFDQGFDIYFEPTEFPTPAKASLIRAMEWLASEPAQPFFLFLHTYDVHFPYTPPPPFDRRYDPDYVGTYEVAFTADDYKPGSGSARDLDARTVQHLAALYDGEIRGVDSGIGELLALLDDQGLAESTCVVLTADHGEEFEEHGDLFHRHGKLYEELVHVPLIVRCPSRIAARVVDEPVGVVDVTPTLLDIAGVSVPVGLDGRSLYPALLGGPLPVRDGIVMEVDGSIIKKDGRVAGVRGRRYKLIGSSIDGSEQLFDLALDPRETHDVRQQKPGIAARLAARLEPVLRRGDTQGGR